MVWPIKLSGIAGFVTPLPHKPSVSARPGKTIPACGRLGYVRLRKKIEPEGSPLARRGQLDESYLRARRRLKAAKAKRPSPMSVMVIGSGIAVSVKAAEYAL